MKNNILTDGSYLYSCTGCSVCAISCSRNAITIKLTQDGFYEPVIDESLCTGCGLCKKSCYKFDDNVTHKKENECLFYSAINKDSNELKTATSGAVSSELMKQCILEGYNVLGVAYDYDKNIAVTKIVSSNEDIGQFKGSKYFQSYTLDAFYEALRDKSKQKYAVFGTPCQIYAISKYIDLNKKRDKFILVDIFCHGCPSMNLWTKYIEYNKRKLGVDKFDKIEFRSKTHGWHEFCTTFHSGKGKFSSPKINDMFYTMFFDKNALNNACYDCKMRSSLAYSDIRLGDFWGYQYDTNISGVSAVVLCSDKGKQLFDKVKYKFEICKHTVSETIEAQSYGKQHLNDAKLRDYTLKLLASELFMEEVIKTYKNTYSFKKKIKVVAKNTMKSLPQKLYLLIKRTSHKVDN